MIEEMSFEEKHNWIQLFVTIASYATYLTVILFRAAGAPLTEVAYVTPMLITIGVTIGALILGSVILAALWPKECDKQDQRDKEIHRFGEYVGQSLFAVGALGALVLSMLEADHFWISNIIYLGGALSAVLGSVVKLVAYRRGI